MRMGLLKVTTSDQGMDNEGVQEIIEYPGLNYRLWRKLLAKLRLENCFISVIPSIKVIQSSCATSGDGLYEGLEWVQDTLSEREVKKTLQQPLTETAKSASGTTPKPSLLSTWVSSIGGYLQGKTVITA